MSAFGPSLNVAAASPVVETGGIVFGSTSVDSTGDDVAQNISPLSFTESKNNNLQTLHDIFTVLKSKTESDRDSRTALLAGLPHLLDRDDVFAYLGECTEDAVVVRKELVLMKGNELLTSRVFVRLKDGVCSYDIGWIVARDVPNCMVCSTPFVFFRTRRHCYACGGVFCWACTENRAYIEECTDFGEVPVCQLCYFGQSEISVCHETRKAQPDRLASGPSIVSAPLNTSAEETEDSETRGRSISAVERLKVLEEARLRVKTNAEFRAALECLNQSSLLETSGRPVRRGSAKCSGFVTDDDPPAAISPSMRLEPSRRSSESVSPSSEKSSSPARPAPHIPDSPTPTSSTPAFTVGPSSPSSPTRAPSYIQRVVRQLSRSMSSPTSPSAVKRPSSVRAEPGVEDIVIEGIPASCAGYLMKYGLRSSFNKAWKKRYFVLTDNVLRYFDDHSLTRDTTAKRTTTIAPSTQISVEVADSKQFMYLILIEDRTLAIELLLGTNSYEDKEKWIHKLSAIYGPRK